MHTSITVALLATIAACGGTPAESPPAKQRAPVATTKAAPTVSQPAPVIVEPTWQAAEAPGPLYMTIENRSLWMIDVDGTTQPVSGASANYVHRTSDGQVFATSAVGQPSVRVYRVTGTTAKALPTLPTPRAAFGEHAIEARGDDVAIAFSSDDAKVVRLARLRGTKWVTEKVEANVGQIDAIAFGAGDEVWLAGWRGVAVRRGGAWTSYECPSYASCVDAGLARAGDQIIYQARDRGVWRDYEPKDGKLVLRVNGPAATWSSTGYGRNGSQLTLKVGDPHLEVRHRASLPTGTTVPWRTSDRGTLDGAGRVWTVGDNALAVADLRTGTITRYPQRAFGINASSIRQFVAAGGGPALPSVPAAKLAKTVVGVLKINGVFGTTGANLRVCPDAHRSATDPCSDSSPAFSVTMGANGTFELADVPQGTYDIAFKSKTSDGNVQWVPMTAAFDVKAGERVRLPMTSLSLTEHVSYF